MGRTRFTLLPVIRARMYLRANISSRHFSGTHGAKKIRASRASEFDIRKVRALSRHATTTPSRKLPPSRPRCQRSLNGRVYAVQITSTTALLHVPILRYQESRLLTPVEWNKACACARLCLLRGCIAAAPCGCHHEHFRYCSRLALMQDWGCVRAGVGGESQKVPR